jgi:hypothetical protein
VRPRFAGPQEAASARLAAVTVTALSESPAPGGVSDSRRVRGRSLSASGTPRLSHRHVTRPGGVTVTVIAQ